MNPVTNPSVEPDLLSGFEWFCSLGILAFSALSEAFYGAQRSVSLWGVRPLSFSSELDKLENVLSGWF